MPAPLQSQPDPVPVPALLPTPTTSSVARYTKLCQQCHACCPGGSAPGQGVHGCLQSRVCSTAQLRGFTQGAHSSLESLRSQLTTFPAAATAGFSFKGRCFSPGEGSVHPGLSQGWWEAAGSLEHVLPSCSLSSRQLAEHPVTSENTGSQPTAPLELPTAPSCLIEAGVVAGPPRSCRSLRRAELCVNYRKINEDTVQNSFSPFSTDDILHFLALIHLLSASPGAPDILLSLKNLKQELPLFPLQLVGGAGAHDGSGERLRHTAGFKHFLPKHLPKVLPNLFCMGRIRGKMGPDTGPECHRCPCCSSRLLQLSCPPEQ